MTTPPPRPVWSRLSKDKSTLMVGMHERGRLSEIVSGMFYLSMWRTDRPEEVAVSDTFNAPSIKAAEAEGMRRYLALTKNKVEVPE